MPEQDLAGRVAIVTGAGHGLGRAIALELAAHGCALVVIARRQGCIVNISSILGLTAFPIRAAYAAAKHGLIGLTKVLAVEWGPHGIRVNAVAPGMFPMERGIVPRMRATPEEVLARTPLGRFGEAEEVGRLVHYLVSDAAFISGATLTIDGGWTAYGSWSLDTGSP
jgi:NAD(P)-dependent dehydrogenase (short-subunit alcohol dehydrogenase family)